MGLLYGLLYILLFSRITSIRITTINDTIVNTPMSLFGNTLRRLNDGRKYHSGRISSGVENAFEGQINDNGANTDNPRDIPSVPRITDGKTYNMSFGHAGSPYVLCPVPVDNLDITAFLVSFGILLTTYTYTKSAFLVSFGILLTTYTY